MKATVVVAYTDKYSDEVRLPGQVVDESRDRIRELSDGGFVRAGDGTAESDETPADAVDELSDMTVADLKGYIKAHGGTVGAGMRTKSALLAAARELS